MTTFHVPLREYTMATTPEVIAEYIFRDKELFHVDYHHMLSKREYWIDVTVDRKPYGSLGPFASEEERQRVLDDFLDATRALGAKDLPMHNQ